MNLKFSRYMAESHHFWNCKFSCLHCRLKRLRYKCGKNPCFSSQESESTMMSYILNIKWLSGCSEVGDHTKEVVSHPTLLVNCSRLIMRINMVDDWSLLCNEGIIYPSFWKVDGLYSYNHIHIFIIYKLPHKFPNNLKALEIRKYHKNLKLIELLPSAYSPSS